MNNLCSISGCMRGAYRRSFCATHYYHWKKYGDPLKYGKRVRGICTVVGCGKPHVASGYCRSHWYRFKTHGNPFGGATVPGTPIQFLTSIPLDGEGCLYWPYAKNGVGYAQISIRGQKHLVTRITCERRNGPPPTPKHHAAHSCGKGHLGCVAPWHLSWKLPVDNAADMVVHGTRLRGERAPWSRLTDTDVRSIRALAGRISQEQIGLRFGISQTMAGKIIRRERWAHIH